MITKEDVPVLDSLFLPVYTSTDQITASVYLVCSLASLALGAVIAFAAGSRNQTRWFI